MSRNSNTKRNVGLTVMLCFLIPGSPLLSQRSELRIRNYSVTEGLSHNTVHCITQDEKGFLWIGTEDGLNRFDGYSFTVFKKSTQDPDAIADNFINCLYVDRAGTLWVGSNSNGIIRYDRYTDSFKTFSTFEYEGITTPFRIIYSIVADSKGHLWVGSFSGLFEFDPATERIISQYHYDGTTTGLPDEEVRCLFMDEGDILWIGTNSGGLCRFDIHRSAFTHYRYSRSDHGSISDNSVSSILRDSSGKLWVGTGWGLNIMDEGRGQFRRFNYQPGKTGSLSNNIVFSLAEDHLGNIWAATLNGLNRYERDSESFTVWNYIPTVHQTISDNYIFTAFEDRYGQMWLGTGTKGLDKFNNRTKKFSHFYVNPESQEGMANNTIREIYEDDKGFVWLGILDGGLYTYDRRSSEYRSYRHDPADPASLSDDRINTIYKDSRGNVWIGTWGGGLNLAIPTGEGYRFRHYLQQSALPLSISNNIVKEVTEDRFGRLWIGTESGLDLFDPAKGETLHFPLSKEDRESPVLRNIQSGCLLFDSRDNLWVGTWNGLTKVILSPATRLPQNYIHYTHNDTSSLSLSDNRVIALYQDGDSLLWAGTFSGGLLKLSLDGNGMIKSVRNYTEQDGLSNNVVYNILADEERSLWLSTNNGLSRLNPRTEKFDNYDVDDGLQSNQFYWGAACRFRSGELAFGGINGYNSFNPAEIIPDKAKPDMVLTDFRIFGRKPEISAGSVLRKSITYADTILLKYDDSSISFEFAALQFAEPAKNKYAYRLEGFSDEWTYTESTRRFAIFTNLDPGEYTFVVKGSNADGTWDEEGTRIKILISPPFWQTWWFRVLMILFFLSLLALFYHLRVRDLSRQKRELEKTVKEKTAEIMHRNLELQSINREFVEANMKLEHQRQELEALLKSLKETQNQLIQSEKMASLGLLAAGIAHEINNPLNFINLGVEGLKSFLHDNNKDDIEKVTPIIRAIQDGVRRAADIVASLNLYSRRDDLPATEVDLHKVIDSCLVMLNSKIRSRIIVGKEYTRYPLKVYGNEGRVHQVFLNILTNAIQSIEDQGVITITTEKKKGNCVVSVSDNGCGMNEDIIPRITDPFFTTKDPGKGTGLGLSITYNILSEMGGKIEFRSEVNVGTTVRVTIPFYQKSV